MNTTATKAAAAKVAKPKKAKVSHAKQEALPLPAAFAQEFGMLALDRITVLEQVRTEFDDDSLKELAEDIAARGILQPLTVRADGDRFILVAGERRLRAAHLAKLDAVPVLISGMTEDDHHAAQLAENIQRENLSTLEESRAIRKLYDLGKNVTEIAAFVHKSKAWVSKRLAAADPSLSWNAKALLEDGITEDLELVLTVSNLAKADFYEANLLCKAIRAGTAGRETARETLAKVKEANAAQQAEIDARHEKFNSPEAVAKREAEQAAWKAQQKAQEELYRARFHIDPRRLLARFHDWTHENRDKHGAAWLEGHDAEQIASIADHLASWHASGEAMTAEQLASRLLLELTKAEHENWEARETVLPSAEQLAALSWASMSPRSSFDLADFLSWYKGHLIDPALNDLDQ